MCPLQVALSTPFSEGVQIFPVCKPWLDTSDSDNILFARCACVYCHAACMRLHKCVSPTWSMRA